MCSIIRTFKGNCSQSFEEKKISYKLQLLYAIRPGDNRKRYDFAVEILNEIDKGEQFLHRVNFSDETTFHVSSHVHRHNVRIWANESPENFVAHERGSPKVNCGGLLPEIALLTRISLRKVL
jgi:hypothetical protein